MKYEFERGKLTVALEGRINAENADGIEEEIRALIAQTNPERLELDADKLVYVASAGLRMTIKLLKSGYDLSVINASPEVYDVFEMTGVTELMDVRRRPREMSIADATLMGKGANGEVWRLDDETIIKVYNEGTSLDKIAAENKVARAAFTAGLPCAIPFDTVHVGDRYGIVFELLNAQTMGQAITADPSRLEELGQALGKLMREMHQTRVRPGALPLMTDRLAEWIDYLEETYLDHEDAELMRQVAAAVPDCDTVLHLDFHEGNVMVQGDELVLIDLDDACCGNPVYDLVNYYAGHVIGAKSAPEAVCGSMGMSAERLQAIYPITMKAYLGTTDEKVLAAHDQAMQLASIYTMLVFLAKGKDSANRTPEVVKGIIAEILPQFRQLAPQISQAMAGFHS